MALLNPLNRGHFLSAKIYPDTKKSCQCGHQEILYKDFHGYKIPECANHTCKKSPELYVIAANVIDTAGIQKRIKIRHSQAGNRLNDIIDVLSTLKQINIEMQRGTFDLRRYTSNQSREDFKFSNVVNSYISANERKLARNELTPAGLSDKVASIKNLLPYFTDTDIGAIDDRMIRNFYDSFTDKFRTRDKAVQELKTILKYAVNDGRIDKIPKFPSIAPAKMVNSQNFLTKEQQNLVISKIENPIYRAAIKVLAMYALRPCEVRSLKWKNIDRKKNTFYIQSHISRGSDISGRKSQTSASHELPIMPEFEEILDSIPQSINPEGYVFKGEKGGFIGTNALTKAWNKACKEANVKNATLYIGTKHSTLSLLSSKATDAQLVKLSGHTNSRMLRRYAQSNIDDIKKLLGVINEG